MNEDMLLDDDFINDESASAPELASRGTRFINFIIDYLFAVFLLPFIIGLIMLAVGMETLIDRIANMDSISEFLFGVILSTCYYSLLEYFANGKTIGKMITRTRAIHTTGKPLTYPQVLGRTISRFVPLEPFSFFGDKPVGWHDQWSDTRVVVDG